MKALAERPPETEGGEEGGTYPGEVLRAPESVPLTVTVPGAPSPFPPAEPAAPDGGQAKRKRAA